MSEMILPAYDGGPGFSAYLAMPAVLPAPAVVVIQEIFGVNEGMRRICDGLAQAGFIAVCPDLFWRLERNVQLSDKTKQDWDKALDLMNRFDIDLGVEDLRMTEHTFKGHAECTGKVGCIGYCLGGKLAFLTAARTNIHCAVSYYGVGIEGLLDEDENITCPTMLHIAERDRFVPSTAQQAIKYALSPNPNITIHSYPNVDHAFARIDGDHYDKNAADLANGRTLAFLQSSLAKAKAA